MTNWHDAFYPYWREGTLAQSDGDTGDSSQRLATFWVLMWIIGYQNRLHYDQTIVAHEIVPGRYRRSPIQSFWGSDPTNFSRDQQNILNLAFAIVGDKKRLWESCKAIFFRAGFHQNFLRGTDDPTKYWKVPDFITHNQITVFIRGMDLWPLYPILFVLDILIFFDFIFRKTHLWDADNMMAQNLFYASSKMPTPWSRICFHLYQKTDFLDRLKHYHTSNNGIKPLYDLYESAYHKLRGEYEKNYFDRAIIKLFRLRYKDSGQELRQD